MSCGKGRLRQLTAGSLAATYQQELQQAQVGGDQRPKAEVLHGCAAEVGQYLRDVARQAGRRGAAVEGEIARTLQLLGAGHGVQQAEAVALERTIRRAVRCDRCGRYVGGTMPVPTCPHCQGITVADPSPAPQPAKRSRVQSRGTERNAEAGQLSATSYKGVATSNYRKLDRAYYRSAEMAAFVADVHATHDRYGVQVTEVRDTVGLWQGEVEPSTVSELRGAEAGMRAAATELGIRHQQYGMLITIPDPAGDRYSYRLRGLAEEQVQTVMDTMVALGLAGARYEVRFEQGVLTIDDVSKTGGPAIMALAKELGIKPQRMRARLILLNGCPPSEVEPDCDYVWTQERESLLPDETAP